MVPRNEPSSPTAEALTRGPPSGATFAAVLLFVLLLSDARALRLLRLLRSLLFVVAVDVDAAAAAADGVLRLLRLVVEVDVTDDVLGA